jgi:hypothetical protein
VQVDVEQAGFQALAGKRYAKIGRHRAFSHSPFAGQDHDFVPDCQEGLLDFEILLGAM